jgi:CheY-like chemotaxis protein
MNVQAGERGDREMIETEREPGTGSRPRGRTVLVADDEAKIRDLVRDVLEPCGFEVLEAGNGHGVLAELQRTRVDLLVLDLAMPEMEGIETLQKLRALRPDLKVLVISGAFGGHFLRCAQHLGAHAGLKKPFSCDSLILQVEALLAA